MVAKHPPFTLPWHSSDQPDQLRDPALKRRLRLLAAGEYAIAGATAGALLPLWLASYARLACGARFPDAGRPAAQPIADFLGVALSPLPGREALLRDLLDELGVRRLEVRVPVWQRDQLDRLMAFIAGLAPRPVLAVICQDRGSVCDHRGWRRDLRRILSALPENVHAVQIGNAVNRRKWGCAHLGEYLDLLEIAAEVHAATRPRLALAGSSIIDFEPLGTLRSLVNRRRFRLDACSALLYVDRRGGPDGRQYGVFDTARKIRCVASLIALSRRCAPHLWITELNWPLAGQKGHAPASSQYCVSELAAADYLRSYCRIAYDGGLVQRLYLWQLVARGYGLVDLQDDGAVRRRPAFEAVRELLAGDLSTAVVARSRRHSARSAAAGR